MTSISGKSFRMEDKYRLGGKQGSRDHHCRANREQEIENVTKKVLGGKKH